ncbi:protein translocation complex, SEC61 gamma subunit [Cardiosporidium cionae]|uniref:Protein translocation complex, SEC61 gamma subunit n=1 Tax=Cardiosporidium cionae TaxID=476202 RepID=A0ABQ7J925_9APIC|nr:protein translocation complex, SEC61 gamma subunit [Cardiosporidium cionae]|eukprot:KAF8820498.1 protein translocation complex, SEC61 gamma subunit [Cardiosporidium cionae]
MVKLPLPSSLQDPGHPLGYVFVTLRSFALDSIRLVRRCTKPDPREFKQVTGACAVGFLAMGVIGFLVKLIFIPINNLLVGNT